MQHTSTTYQDLLPLSEMVVNGRILQKLDLIGTISIYNSPYFTVYRRYNNVHEMIVVDYNGDVYLQKDLSLIESIRRILCLSEEQMADLRLVSSFSFKHQAPPPTMSNRIPDMTWSEINETWYGISINLEGILRDFHDRQETNPLPPMPPSSSAPSPTFQPAAPYPTPSMGPTVPKEQSMQKEQLKPLHPSDEELVRLLIELQASSKNPTVLPEEPVELSLDEEVKECTSVKPPKRKWSVKKEEGSSVKSPPSSPRMNQLLILRNGRELRRKIS